MFFLRPHLLTSTDNIYKSGTSCWQSYLLCILALSGFADMQPLLINAKGKTCNIFSLGSLGTTWKPFMQGKIKCLVLQVYPCTKWEMPDPVWFYWGMQLYMTSLSKKPNKFVFFLFLVTACWSIQNRPVLNETCPLVNSAALVKQVIMFQKHINNKNQVYGTCHNIYYHQQKRMSH